MIWFYEDQQLKETNVALSLAMASPKPFRAKNQQQKNPRQSFPCADIHFQSFLQQQFTFLVLNTFPSVGCQNPAFTLSRNERSFECNRTFFSFSVWVFLSLKESCMKTRKVSLMCMCRFKIKAPSHILRILPRSSNYRIICDFKHEFFGCCSCLALLR